MITKTLHYSNTFIDLSGLRDGLLGCLRWIRDHTLKASRSPHSFQSAVTTRICPLAQQKCMITKTLHYSKPSLIALHLTPTPMCKEKPTLRWGYVQTRTRREKVCPLYRVLGSLRIWKNSAFGSLKTCSPPAVICSSAQWICSPLVFG
jgi:hypothetical protein